MFSIEDLTNKFNSLDDEHKNGVFRQLTANIQVYSQIMPDLPLIKYIIGGESAVPVNQHGPIITRYKEWAASRQQ